MTLPRNTIRRGLLSTTSGLGNLVVIYRSRGPPALERGDEFRG